MPVSASRHSLKKPAFGSRWADAPDGWVHGLAVECEAPFLDAVPPHGSGAGVPAAKEANDFSGLCSQIN